MHRVLKFVKSNQKISVDISYRLTDDNFCTILSKLYAYHASRYLHKNFVSLYATSKQLFKIRDRIMTTTATIIIRNPSDDNIQTEFEGESVKMNQSNRLQLFPDYIVESFERNEKEPLAHAHSTSEIRINLSPNQSLTTSRESNLNELKEHVIRRIHSSIMLRSVTRCYSTQMLTPRFFRRQTSYLSRTSKWYFIRTHLKNIALMNESYARMKSIEQDRRWDHLAEQIRKQVLDMREISILRQQDIGQLKKSQKTSFNLKAIPSNEVVHVEHNGQVYSIGTRDLVLGRLIGNQDIQLDTFAHLDARRKFAVKQDLVRQQEGRNRLKKHIAFSFCLCNLSFIVLMFVTMFFCAAKTFFELKSQKYL